MEKKGNDSEIAFEEVCSAYICHIKTRIFISLFVVLEYVKSLFEVEDRSNWKGCHVRYQRLNSAVSQRQSTCVSEEGSDEIFLGFALAFKFEDAQIT